MGCLRSAAPHYSRNAALVGVESASRVAIAWFYIDSKIVERPVVLIEFWIDTLRSGTISALTSCPHGFVLTNYNEESIMPLTATDPIKIIFAILLPPLGVFLEVGLKGHFWLNILLTIFGFIPGIIHALYVILKH